MITPTKKKVKAEIEDFTFIVDDYAHVIKEGREKKKLTQEELALNIKERHSLIHNIESSGLKPSLELAKKLEKYLGITLIEKYQSEQGFEFGSSHLTIGDLVKKK